MKKTRIILIILGLLAAWAVLLTTQHKKSTTIPAHPAVVKTVPQKSPEISREAQPKAQPQTTSSLGREQTSRDPFQLPMNLKEAIRLRRERVERARKEERQRELAKQLEQQKQQRQEAPVPALPPPSLKLQGILWGDKSPQVIINRRVLSTGDKIEGATVVFIRKEGVTMSFEGREYELKLEHAQTQRPPEGGGPSTPGRPPRSVTGPPS